MNDKDKLISFINKGKEDNPIKEVHVIKDNDTENHILLVNEDGTSIASNKFEVGGASNDNSGSSILRKNSTFVSNENGTIMNSISLSSEEYNKIKNGEINIIYGECKLEANVVSRYKVVFDYINNGDMYNYEYTDVIIEDNRILISNYQLTITEQDATLAIMKTTQPRVPTLPTDASSKTYVLKSVNGVLTWSE